MAIAAGVSLGTPVTNTGAQATSIGMTTNVTVPSGSMLSVAVSWYNTGITASMGGGGLTWALDAQVNGVTDTARHLALFSAQAPAGLATAAALTASFSGAGAFGRAIYGFYYTGLATSSAKDVVSAGGTGAVAAWNTGANTTTVADEAVVGACWFDGVVTSSTPNGTDTEPAGLDFNNALDASWVYGYRIVSSIASYSIGGTFASTAGGAKEWLAIMVAYKAPGGGGGAVVKQLSALGVG